MTIMRLPAQSLFYIFAIFTAILPSTSAVFSDDAYVTDYHHALIGLPQEHTTFFHRPRKEEKASLLYTLSDQNVLGAVNPGNGALVWRQFLAPNLNSTLYGDNTAQGFLRPAEGDGSVVSAIGGAVKSWDSLSGREKWSNDFEGFARDLEILEAVGQETQKDILVLFEQPGKGVLRRLNGATGNVIWEFVIESGDLPWQVSTDVKSVYLVSLHGSRGGYNLKITSVDPVTGKRTDEHTLSTKSDVHSPEDVLLVGANMAAPIVAWTDKAVKTLKVNVLGSKQVHSLSLSAGGEEVVKVAIHAPQLIQSVPHFLVHSQSETSHWAEVYHIDIVAGTVAEAYHLPKLPGKGAFSTSSQDANVYFTRNTDDEVILVSSASHAVLGRWPSKSDAGSGSALHGVSEVVSKGSSSFSVRSAIVTTADNWSLIRNGVSDWTRVEGVSGVVAAAWAEIPEEENLAKTLEAEAHSNPISAYIHRLDRHINDLQYLPGYLQSLPGKLISSLLPGDPAAVPAGPLARDSFGFRKLVIIATDRARIYALDTGNQGNIVWSTRAFNLPAGEKWVVKGIHVDKTRNVVTVRGSSGGEYATFRIQDGALIENYWRGVFPPLQSTAIVETPIGEWLIPIGEDGKPEKIPANWAPKDIIVVRGKKGEVKGIKFIINGEDAVPTTLWSFLPVSGQKVLSVTARASHEPVASIGRALGDRTVLYKYLNPNTILVTTVSEKASTAHFYLLDSVSGDVLYSTSHEHVDTTQPIPSVVSENWFAYSIWTDISSGTSSAKGYQLVVSDLYESSIANDRGPLPPSNYSSLNPSEAPLDEPYLPHVKTQAFIIPEPISHLAVSQTRQGITSRQLLAALPLSNAIIGIPRQVLDPRRPVGRKPTPGEAEEGLIEYSPVIEFAPQLIITHRREVLGIKNILTTPALLESTSLVFAYGVDIFGTRITPSLAFDILGKGFNRLSLIATVLALIVGVAVLAPMVRRKQINARWKPA